MNPDNEAGLEEVKIIEEEKTYNKFIPACVILFVLNMFCLFYIIYNRPPKKSGTKPAVQQDAPKMDQQLVYTLTNVHIIYMNNLMICMDTNSSDIPFLTNKYKSSFHTTLPIMEQVPSKSIDMNNMK